MKHTKFKNKKELCFSFYFTEGIAKTALPKSSERFRFDNAQQFVRSD